METILIHTFTREEVKTLDFRRFDALFSHWPQLWAMELRTRLNSLVFLVEGFDRHPDEVYLIPEVRKFFQALHQRWPWWCYFLNLETNSLPLAYLCLLESVSSIKLDGATNCAASFDPNEIAEIIRHDLGRMNWLWGHAGLSESENERRSQQIMQAFQGGAFDE